MHITRKRILAATNREIRENCAVESSLLPSSLFFFSLYNHYALWASIQFLYFLVWNTFVNFVVKIHFRFLHSRERVQYSPGDRGAGAEKKITFREGGILEKRNKKKKKGKKEAKYKSLRAERVSGIIYTLYRGVIRVNSIKSDDSLGCLEYFRSRPFHLFAVSAISRAFILSLIKSFREYL